MADTTVLFSCFLNCFPWSITVRKFPLTTVAQLLIDIMLLSDDSTCKLTTKCYGINQKFYYWNIEQKMWIQVIFVFSFSFGHYVFSRILDNTIRLSAPLKFSNRHYDTNRRNYHSQSSASHRLAFYTLGKSKPLNKIWKYRQLVIIYLVAIINHFLCVTLYN